MESLRIRPVKKGSNRYCGPAALSIITGMDTDRTAKLIREISGQRFVKGTAYGTMIWALEKLGYSCLRLPADKMTLVQFVNMVDQDKMFLICAGNHYSIVQGRRYCCGQTKAVVEVDGIPHPKSRITKACEITKVRDVDFDSVSPAPVKPQSQSWWFDRLIANRTAKANSVTVDESEWKDREIVWVYPPDDLFNEDGDGDPYYDEHFHDDWKSARAAVETYAKLVKDRCESRSSTETAEAVA